MLRSSKGPFIVIGMPNRVDNGFALDTVQEDDTRVGYALMSL